MKCNSRPLAKYVECLSFNSQNWRAGGVEHICALLATVLRQTLHSSSLPILHYRRVSVSLIISIKITFYNYFDFDFSSKFFPQLISALSSILNR